jgi:hypothetical protein
VTGVEGLYRPVDVGQMRAGLRGQRGDLSSLERSGAIGVVLVVRGLEVRSSNQFIEGALEPSKTAPCAGLL